MHSWRSIIRSVSVVVSGIAILFWHPAHAAMVNAVWDHTEYLAESTDENRYEEDLFEADSNCSGCLSWRRDGTYIGRATHVSDRSQRYLFTDFVQLERNELVAEQRKSAQELGCWHGFTPDMVCANGGWNECFDASYSYESCCLGWVTKKNEDDLHLVRSAHFLQSDMNGRHIKYFYGNALVFSGMLQLDLRTRDRSHNLTLVELGVLEGGFAHTMLTLLDRQGKHVAEYYLVDIWQDEDHGGKSRERFLTTVSSLEQWWKVTRILQHPSHLAAKLFEDESVDFVFVDAVHRYNEVYQDLEAWWPKLRKGGYLAGHDYVPHRPTAYSGVLGAVQNFANDYSLTERLIGVTGNSFVIFK